MYCYSFKKFAGHDRVFKAPFSVGKAGDLLATEGDFLLNLGEGISFPELIHHQYPPTSASVIYPAFFDQHFLSFLHRMVYERYTSYKSVIKYFVSSEIPEMLAREQRAKPPKKIQISSLGEYRFETTGQYLLIFPDNRTRYNLLSPELLEDKSVINLVSSDTQNRKNIHRREAKQGKSGIVVATHSEVFQPFSNLKKILIFDPHKWYYNNQQDPRYHLPTVAKKMGEIY